LTLSEGDLWNLFIDDLTFLPTTPPTELQPRGCYSDCMGCCGDMLCEGPGNPDGMTDGVPGLTFLSLDPTVATVDPGSGLVTPTGIGTTLVMIEKAGWDTVYAQVTVKGLAFALSFPDENTLAWPPQKLAAAYDAVWGDLEGLRTDGLSAASGGFLACDEVGTSVGTSEPPPPVGEGHWYLARTVYAAAVSTFDTWEHWPASRQTAPRDAAIDAAGLACPSP
jgi:hypothetical protein